MKLPWRHASCIIVAARNTKPLPVYKAIHPKDPTGDVLDEVLGGKNVAHSPNDVSILMVKRRSDARFMPSVFTFPGGALHETDFAKSWSVEYLRGPHTKTSDGFGPDYWSSYLNSIESKPSRPPPIAHYQELCRRRIEKTKEYFWMPAEWAYKLAALRELFEETGILICYDLTDNAVRLLTARRADDAMTTTLESYRRRVHDDAEQFVNICADLRVIPAFWLLREWSNWLSPCTYAAGKRFDTMFYVVCLNEQLQVDVEPTELETFQWVDPKLFLQAGSTGDVQLAPPQIYELARLAQFQTISKLSQFSKDREQYGLPQFCPLLARCTDDMRLAILPGDDLYPANQDVYACDQPFFKIGSDSETSRRKAKRLHRAEFLPSSASTWSLAKIFTNIEPTHNHVTPIQSFD